MRTDFYWSKKLTDTPKPCSSVSESTGNTPWRAGEGESVTASHKLHFWINCFLSLWSQFVCITSGPSVLWGWAAFLNFMSGRCFEVFGVFYGPGLGAGKGGIFLNSEDL